MLINGKNYSWSSLSLIINGTAYTGFTEISYKQSQTKENNYGIGDKPISRGYGNKSYEGSITMYRDTWQSIIEGSPANNPLDLPFFNIIVQYQPTSTGILIKRDTLVAAEFTEDGITVAQGDTKILVTLPIIFADLIHA